MNKKNLTFVFLVVIISTVVYVFFNFSSKSDDKDISDEGSSVDIMVYDPGGASGGGCPSGKEYKCSYKTTSERICTGTQTVCKVSGDYGLCYEYEEREIGCQTVPRTYKDCGCKDKEKKEPTSPTSEEVPAESDNKFSNNSSSDDDDDDFYIAPGETINGYYSGVNGSGDTLSMVGWVCDTSNSAKTYEVNFYFDGYESDKCVSVNNKMYCGVTDKLSASANQTLNQTTASICGKSNTWFRYYVPSEIKTTAYRDFVIAVTNNTGEFTYLPPANSETLRLKLEPEVLNIDTSWSSVISALTMPDGTTGKPSAQAELYLGKIPNTNKGLILQTVVMQSNNKAYSRYGTFDFNVAATTNDRTQWTTWSPFTGPVGLDVFAIPNVTSGTINAYGLTLVSPTRMMQTVFVNNVGYARFLDFVVNNNNGDGVATIQVDGSWKPVTLGNSAPGTSTIQAYDLAYYSHDGGFYLETYSKDNNFYYRFIRANGGSVNLLTKEGATSWLSPIPASTLPGQGDVITYSYYIINDKDYLSQAFWKSTSGGYFRELRSTVMNYPDDPGFDIFDVNKDGNVDILDIIFLIQELFN